MAKIDLSPTEAAAIILTDAKEQVIALLAANFSTVNITVESSLNRLIGTLNFMSGANAANTSLSKAEMDSKFPPILNDESETTEVTEETLDPKELQKLEFKNRVLDFMANIPNLENEKILENYATKDDLNIVRGAAKMAGLDDFKKAEINGTYLDLIRTTLVAQNLLAAEKEAINENIN